MNEFYVYAYLRKDGSPYYIGKGKGKRAWGKDHAVALPTDERIHLIETDLSEKDSLQLERDLIQLYGRKHLNTGILRNITEGGDAGPKLFGNLNPMFGKLRPDLRAKNLARVGTKQSPETIEKIRSSSLGKNLGKFRSSETKAKISLKLTGRIVSEETKEKHRQRVPWNKGRKLNKEKELLDEQQH